MPLIILSKYADNPLKYIQVKRADNSKMQKIDLFKGHNSKMVNAI